MALNQILTDIHPSISKIDDAVLTNEWDAWIPHPRHTRSHQNEFFQAVTVYWKMRSLPGGVVDGQQQRMEEVHRDSQVV